MVELDGGGRLCIEEAGGFVCCEVTRPNDGRGIYKVWLDGNGDGFLLGTLVPEGDALCLRRRVSRDSLVRAGCWPVGSGRCVLTFPFRRSGWVREPTERRMTDPVLRQAARGLSALIWVQDGGFRLAVPFECTCPFPLVPAFCFARVERVEGRLHAVFCFDGQGRPQMQD